MNLLLNFTLFFFFGFKGWPVGLAVARNHDDML